MTCVTLSQLLCVPTVRTEKSGSVSVWHNDSADAIFIGCWTNISLPWKSPVKNSPAAATSATRLPAIVAGRYETGYFLASYDPDTREFVIPTDGQPVSLTFEFYLLQGSIENPHLIGPHEVTLTAAVEE